MLLGRLCQLLSLSWVANPSDKLNTDCTEHEVDTGDEIFERVEPKEDFKSNLLVLGTDLLALGMTICVLHYLWISCELICAEALQRATGGQTIILDHKIIIIDRE